MADMIVKGVHGCSREDEYVRPEDPLIRERLEWFRDQKLALFTGARRRFIIVSFFMQMLAQV